MRQGRQVEAPEKAARPLIVGQGHVLGLVFVQVEILDLAARELFAQRFPVVAGDELPLFEDRAYFRLIGRDGLGVIALRLKVGIHAAQILHRVHHLAEGVIVIAGIVFDDLLIPVPGGHVFVAYEAVVRQMPGPAVAQVHDGAFAALVNAVVIDARHKIVGAAGTVVEDEGALCPVGHQLIEIAVGVVDDQRRRAREIAVRPGVGQHMHGDARRLEAAALCKLHRVGHERAVGVADEAVLVLIQAPALLHRGIQVAGQEMEGGPDARDVLEPDEVRARVHHLKLELGRGGGERGPEL